MPDLPLKAPNGTATTPIRYTLLTYVRMFAHQTGGKRERKKEREGKRFSLCLSPILSRLRLSLSRKRKGERGERGGGGGGGIVDSLASPHQGSLGRRRQKDMGFKVELEEQLLLQILN